MSYAIDFAKELKNRNNVKRVGNLVGTVLSVTPLKIGILNNEVMLDNSNCYLCSSLIDLIINDKVLVISDALGTEFYIVDKVVM